jgi:hypothetical protein
MALRRYPRVAVISVDEAPPAEAMKPNRVRVVPPDIASQLQQCAQIASPQVPSSPSTPEHEHFLDFLPLFVFVSRRRCGDSLGRPLLSRIGPCAGLVPSCQTFVRRGQPPLSRLMVASQEVLVLRAFLSLSASQRRRWEEYGKARSRKRVPRRPPRSPVSTPANTGLRCRLAYVCCQRIPPACRATGRESP